MKARGPKPGFKPNFDGVPGEIVKIEGLKLLFGKGGRTSPYDGYLQKLAANPAGNAAKFADPRARTSVAVRARKLGMMVSFAMHEGALYVRFDGFNSTELPGKRRLAILDALKRAPGSYIQLANRLRDAGDPGIVASDCEAIILQLQRTGDVIRQEGNTWTISEKARKASA